MAPIRKWHLTAYFEHDDLPSLLTVDTDQELCNITVPPGIFRSGKSRTRQQPSSQESNGGLRWINVDGSTGLVTSSTTSGTGRQSLDISPDMSKAPSPSHSPIFHSSSHTSPRGSTPFTQHSSSRSSSSGSWNSSASQKLPESSREHPITDPRNAHAAYQYHTLQHHHSNSTTPQPLPSASLPPLTVGFASTVLSERPPHARRTSGRIDGVRTTEDMRVIDLLNARTSLS
ncbi:uncharacterized protein EI90DRAFT_523481 [Cantharellus anzutake]|uniref:uncharacterized protein n=1 Tax=Cantharellus anzutake TaxID=1750568 RepID=UPI001907D499|nr:uncharacterized protein EI90DRAFT_523481 [Cantharellus anzutake]KAF8334200.1 hypothetical protein EI90DRAFT_523481 [Cantharellus anzutake]